MENFYAGSKHLRISNNRQKQMDVVIGRADETQQGPKGAKAGKGKDSPWDKGGGKGAKAAKGTPPNPANPPKAMPKQQTPPVPVFPPAPPKADGGQAQPQHDCTGLPMAIQICTWTAGRAVNTAGDATCGCPKCAEIRGGIIRAASECRRGGDVDSICPTPWDVSPNPRDGAEYHLRKSSTRSPNDGSSRYTISGATEDPCSQLRKRPT